MRSVLEVLRAESLAADARRTVDERLRLALATGDRDVRLFARVRRIPEAEARRLLGRQRQQGRRRSPCHESLFA